MPETTAETTQAATTQAATTQAATTQAATTQAATTQAATVRDYGRMADGTKIEAKKVDDQVARYRANPSLMNAILEELGVSRQLSDVEQLRTELQQERTERLRADVINRFQVPEELRHFVAGQTLQEMEQAAQTLMKYAKGQASPATPTSALGTPLIPAARTRDGKLMTAAEIKADILGR